MTSGPFRLLAFLALALGILPPSEAAAKGLNLILLSLDTLRSDRLGCYGYDRPTSPALDALARRGASFQTVVAEASWTLPAHLTLFTGLFPTSHGVTLETASLSPDVPLLAEILRERGYRTAAYTDGGLVAGRFGFSRGFEVYDEKQKELRLTLYRGEKFLESLGEDEPYFLFLHSYEIHCPYHPAEEYAARFRTRPEADHLETEGKCGNTDFNHLPLSEGQARYLSDQYDAGIRAADDALRRFLRFLEARDAFDRTLVVVLSDHGEEFLEHGRIGHEQTLYLESLRVPWLLTAPGLRPRIVPHPAGLADVMPTLLEMLGVPGPRMQGRSWATVARGGSRSVMARPLFSELDRHVRLRSVVDGDHHLIVNLDRGAVSLFDLRVDPYEQRNVGARAERAEALERAVRDHFDSLPAGAGVTLQLSPEERKRLEALGYLR